MKNIIILFLVSPVISAFSQFSIESNFNRNGTANNQTLTVNYSVKNWTIGGGVKYLFNKKDNFPQSVFYKRTFWALNNTQHYGANLFALYKIWDLPRVNFDVFYDFQFTKSATRFETFFAIGQLVEEPQSEYDYIFIKHTDYIGPILGFENNIGLCFSFDITRNFYFSQKAGVGMLFYKELDPNTTIIGAGNWVFTEMLSFGVGWKFGDNVTKPE
jgi:hypothetical protein